MKGKLFTCSHCGYRTPVPERTLAAPKRPSPPALDPGILGLEIRFLCRACESRLSIDARASDAYVDCPRCGSEIRVPSLPGLPALPPGEEPERPAPVARADDGPSVLDPEEIRFLTNMT
jgi:DNA-directed RNA polymerase subunit RPC12/RpoP